ncbi:MAG TPA: hypothetical protein PK264_17625, partial [Hyphomicrobiaceae bacterium]|nr:hypothetical protein [Hyphomicrobiaceae bacterium]
MPRLRDKAAGLSEMPLCCQIKATPDRSGAMPLRRRLLAEAQRLDVFGDGLKGGAQRGAVARII